MHPSTNPYQPPSFHREPTSADGSFEFNGIIESSDYIELLPPKDLEWWLYLILTVLVVIVDGLFLLVFIMGVLKRGGGSASHPTRRFRFKGPSRCSHRCELRRHGNKPCGNSNQ